MEVLSPLRLGPERYPAFDRARLSPTEPWFRPSFDQTSRLDLWAPPSPPEEMSSRISLPSIADILNPSRDDDQHSAKRKLVSHAQQSTGSGGVQTERHSQQAPQSYFPPTPPMGLETARKNDSQPLPTLQPQHVSRIDSKSFSPVARYQRPAFTPTSESKPLLNTNVPTLPSQTAMSAPPTNPAPSFFASSRKRPSEGSHARRSRSPPAFKYHPSQIETADAPSSNTTSFKSRSHSAEFPAQQPPTLPSQRPHPSDLVTPSTPSSRASVSLPPRHSLHLDFPPQSQTQPLYQQPYSPQSSPSSTKTSGYDSRVRSMSWNHAPLPQQHPGSPYSSRPPTSSSSSISAPQPGAPTDRYICPTCGKCFSRPSSLRIHSHSHTGEKPFRCSRDGCGKAFSVRSNMKRHEKGCHVGIVVGPGYMSSSVGMGGVSVLPGQAQPVGLGVRGLPSMSNSLPGARELAPALDSS